MSTSALFALLFAATAFAQQFTINTPAAVVQCQPTLLSWSGGQAPYIISAIPAGQVSAASLLDIGNNVNGNQMTWVANLAEGSAITIKIVDATGAVVYTSPINVQKGSDSCMGGASSGGNTGGAAAGGAATGGDSGTPSAAASSAGGDSGAASAGGDSGASETSAAAGGESSGAASDAAPSAATSTSPAAGAGASASSAASKPSAAASSAAAATSAAASSAAASSAAHASASGAASSAAAAPAASSHGAGFRQIGQVGFVPVVAAVVGGIALF